MEPIANRITRGVRAGTTRSKVGLGLFGSQARPGMNGMGALEISQTPLYNYTATAQGLANMTLSTMPFMTHVVVTLGVDGTSPVVTPFSDAGAAGDAFEDVIATPGSRAYVGEFERDGIIGEQHFAATSFFETRFTFEKLKAAWPWIAAGVVVVGGLIYYAKKKPGRAARRRPRARARARGRR